MDPPNAGTQTSVLYPEEADQDELPPLDMPPATVRPLTSADLPPASVFSARPSPRNARLTIERRGGGHRGPYWAIIEREAAPYGVPSEVVDAVMARESGYNPHTVGADGEIGLMQLMPATARMLGFTGTQAELAVPETNIHYGVMYLGTAWRLAGGDICTATMKYRAGHGETRFSYRSVDYCVKVRAHLVARGVAVTGNVPTPTFGQPSGSVRPRRLSPESSAGVDLQALNAVLRQLTDRTAVHAIR
jgi:soluble lytic murein transglycosylase-like protein